jgi:hypothetical protein
MGQIKLNGPDSVLAGADLRSFPNTLALAFGCLRLSTVGDFWNCLMAICRPESDPWGDMEDSSVDPY